MTRITRLMKLHRLMDKATDGTEGSAGGGGVDKGAEDDKSTEGKTNDDGKADKGGDDGDADAAAAAAAAAAANTKKPSDEEAKLLREVMQAKKKITDTNAALSQATEKLKAFDGIDPVKVRALLEAQAKAETERLEAAGDYDRLKKQMADAHAAEKAALQQQLETSNAAHSTLQQQIANLTVGNAFGGSDFVAKELNLTVNKARVIYGSHFEFQDGQVVGFDKSVGSKDRTMLVDAAGSPLNFDDAMRKLIAADPDKDHLLLSKSKPGAGSNGTSRAGRNVSDDSNKPKLNSIEKIAAGLKTLAK